MLMRVQKKNSHVSVRQELYPAAKVRAESSSGASKPPATYESLIETPIRSCRRFVVRRAPVALSSLAVGLGPTFETLFEMSGGVRCVDDWVPPLCGMPIY